ncbi:hypothetical protein ACWCOW_41290 [Streptomyces sp. NPDC001939]
MLLTGSLSAQIWWLQAKAAVPDPVELSYRGANVNEDLGRPVHHVRTGVLAGCLKLGKFIPIEQKSDDD